MKNNLYEILSVASNATDKEITKAYREKAKENHPDKDGDHNKMILINHAYDILSDPEKRKRYDETGQDDFDTYEKNLNKLIIGLFMAIIDNKNDIEYTDIISLCRKEISEGIQEQEISISKAQDHILKYNKVLKRLNTKNGKENIVSGIIQGNISEINRKIAHAQENLKLLKDAYNVVNDYEYQFDKKPPVTVTGHSFTQGWHNIDFR